jgi:16S rRNA (guanine(966)-N(2))-methyltransferase RsmD
MDRMRESVFAVLGDLSGRSFLDLFSGSGIIALEAASRGASRIEAVESDPLKRKILLENAALSPVPIRCRFMAVERYLKRGGDAFDLVFCDPPFPWRYRGELLRALASSALLAEEALVLVHRPRTETLDPPAPAMTRRETRFYGNSAVDFFTAGKFLS